MKYLVTGGAGFIGSHLVDRLLAAGADVTAIDMFTDYYPRLIKESNLSAARQKSRFELVEADLVEADLPRLLDGVDVVYHLAAQPGVRASWGLTFDYYTRNNITASQRLLEALKGTGIKVVLASTSSVYGDADLPMREDGVPRPISPYGVTKLAAENLFYLYRKNFGLNYSALRFFTVYGPRQRPDMAFHKFYRAILQDEEITVFGDGNQTRDFTYVGDIVTALVAAAQSPSGLVCNVGGGNRMSVNDILALMARISGRQPKLRHVDRQSGDAEHTSADLSRAKTYLHYSPAVSVEEGLSWEFEWCRALYA